MPYIDQEMRSRTVELVKHMQETMILTSGELNYLISTLIHNYLGTRPTYASYNEVIGVLELAKLELFRTHVGPYEEEKRLKNGDL